MEKYKSNKEINLFRLWGIKKIMYTNPIDKISAQGDFKNSDEEKGLPESEEEQDDGFGKRSNKR